MKPSFLIPESIFLAYDIRGVYPNQINEKVVNQIVRALINFFPKGRLVISRDNRPSSASLYRTIIKQFNSAAGKFKLVKTGFATTPMFYFLVNKLSAQGGIMVTASHNPLNDNGLKIVGPKAKMISGKKILEIIKNGK